MWCYFQADVASFLLIWCKLRAPQLASSRPNEILEAYTKDKVANSCVEKADPFLAQGCNFTYRKFLLSPCRHSKVEFKCKVIMPGLP